MRNDRLRMTLLRQWTLGVALVLMMLVATVAQAQDGPRKVTGPDPGATETTTEKVEPEATEPEGEATTEEPGATSGEATYDLRVKELEEKVNDFKEKVFRSKSRLVLLKETVLRGSISGSQARLVHSNEMGNAFELVQAIYSLDGNQIYNKRDQDGDLADKEEFEIFNGAIVPGNHNISVMFVYRGSGYGVFSYLKGYKFTIRSSYTFTAEEGKTTEVKIVAYEKGNITTALEERPDVRYEIEFTEDDAAEEVSGGSASNN